MKLVRQTSGSVKAHAFVASNIAYKIRGIPRGLVSYVSCLHN